MSVHRYELPATRAGGRPRVRWHRHRLAECHECDGTGLRDGRWCEYCDGRGYLRPEFCEVCGEPMGNDRRKWKRAQRKVWDDDVVRP